MARQVATSTKTTRLAASGDLRMVSSDLLLMAAVSLIPRIVAED